MSAVLLKMSLYAPDVHGAPERLDRVRNKAKLTEN